MPGKCYREVNGVQRKGTRSTRKGGGGYCKLDRKKDAGARVGMRYGKVVYTSKRGSLFYYNSNGKKTYLRPKQISDTVNFDAPKRRTHQTTSSYLRNNDAPVKHGHVPATKQKTVSARATVIDRIEDDMPDHSQNFQVTMSPSKKSEETNSGMLHGHPMLPNHIKHLTPEQRRIYHNNVKVLTHDDFSIMKLRGLAKDLGLKNLNNIKDAMINKVAAAAATKHITYARADGTKEKTSYDHLAATVQLQIKKYVPLIENKHTAEELKGILKKERLGSSSKLNKREMAEMIATHYRNNKPWKLSKYD